MRDFMLFENIRIDDGTFQRFHSSILNRDEGQRANRDPAKKRCRIGFQNAVTLD